METSQIILYTAASLMVILTPGQDLLLVMSHAISHGSRAGVITASGVSTGLIGHSILAAFGLGALLLASDSLFSIIKMVGAMYLFYLGVKMIVSRHTSYQVKEKRRVASKKLFLTGAFSNISNPHITLFYFAFLPQFIPTTAEQPTMLLFMLGIGFAFLTLLVKGIVGYFAGTLANWIQTHPKVLKNIERLSGLLLISLGLKLAFGTRG